jgi:hypothetical protein
METKKFEDLNIDELWSLRKQVALGSIYVADYDNNFKFDEHCVACFFEGYLDYLEELSEEQGVTPMSLDNKDNLLSWFNCYDDLSWVKNNC